uniref:F-box domain-containing protein n=1 Tax=Meloidogyne javanica TaxID=6303 RepID=A0A915MPW9_MELJA
MLGHNNNSNKQQKLQKQNSMPIVERQLSVIFDTIDFTQVTSPLKPLAELCRLRCKKARLEPKNISEQLPESLWIKIFSYLGPLERISLGLCSRRLQLITSHWLDVNSLEIRPEWANDLAISTGLPLSSGYRRRLPSLRSKPKNQPKSFHLQDSEQPERLLKILLCRLANGQLLELTIWDACLSERLRNCIIRCSQLLRCLRLWMIVLVVVLGIEAPLIIQKAHNCGRWLNTYHPSPLLISLIAKAINAPFEELQLTNCRLSLSALELILPKCSKSLKRLSIGCTFGKEQKRIQHFNSSALFRFIEFYLPKNIRVLRVHHNARRIPNFAEIGGMSSNCSIQEPISTTTKTSLNSCSSPSLSFSNYFSSSTTSSSYQKKYSKGSLFSNNSSIDSSNNDINLTIEQQQNIKLINLKKSSTFHTSSSPRIPSSACSTISWPGTNNSNKEDEQLSLATSSTWCTLSTDLLQNKDNKVKEKSSNCNNLLFNRKLTIFAIAEELLGRMGSPIQSPYVYTTNQNNNQPSGVQRVIHGDLVKTIPLSSLGMESDWESDIE